MAKTKISEYSTTNSDNTDIENINIAEGCAPSGINNAIRELMVHLKEFQTGASGDAFTFAGGTLMSGTNTISGAAIISGNINSSGTNTFSGSNVMSFSGGSSASPSIYFASDTNTGIFSPAADTIAFTEGGVESMRIDSSGNVGIGVTPSAWTTVKPGFQVGPTAFMASYGTSSVASTYTGNNAYFDGSNWKYIVNGSAVMYEMNSGNGSYKWNTAASGTAGNAISFTQAMTLDASGNLGIGTTSPAYKLDVVSTSMRIASGSTGVGYVQYGNSSTATNNYHVGTEGDGTFRFFNGNVGSGTERARITSGGAIWAGNTTRQSTDNHTFIASVTTGDWTTNFQNNAASGAPLGILINYSAISPNGTGSMFLSCSDSTATRLDIRSNGGIANYQANDANLSDRREKTNFAPAKNYLDTICAIPVQTFNYIDQSEDDPGLTLGVVAQDVQEVAPELVMESNWGSKDDPKMRLSIYQTDLQYALMKCIQEQQAIITQLQADVAALKGTA